tara:strand:- start:283 stop:429 length:147 start_codon:yes stop_codon:yes gene_type:complete
MLGKSFMSSLEASSLADSALTEESSSGVSLNLDIRDVVHFQAFAQNGT